MEDIHETYLRKLRHIHKLRASGMSAKEIGVLYGLGAPMIRVYLKRYQSDVVESGHVIS